MKKLLILLATIILGNSSLIFAQSDHFPTSRLLTLDGNYISSSEIFKPNVTTIVVFWNSYEENCREQISLMIDAKEKLSDLTDVNIVAICTDTDGLSSRIKPLINGKDWEIDVYIDRNEDFKRAVNIPSTPFTLVFDKYQNLICEYNGYCAWADDFVCNKIKECLLNADQQPALTKAKEGL